MATTTPQSRHCLKCNHTNPAAAMTSEEACPQCGGIYSRIEAYVKAEKERVGPVSRSGPPTQAPKPNPVKEPERMVDAQFVDTMRAQSLYPTFRSLVKLTTWMLYLVALALVILATNADGALAKISTILGAILLAVIATAAKEAALMMADVSDAAVIRAAATTANVS